MAVCFGSDTPVDRGSGEFYLSNVYAVISLQKLTSVNMVNTGSLLVSNPVENESLCCTVVLPFGIILAKVQPCFASTISWKWTIKVGDRH